MAYLYAGTREVAPWEWKSVQMFETKGLENTHGSALPPADGVGGTE